MADMLPKCILIKSIASGGYAYYMNETDEVRGYVSCQEKSVFSPFAMIEVEAAKTGSKFVHLRFYHSNKYWARRGPGENDSWIIASSNQPEEDKSKSSCTLFEPTFGDEGQTLFLSHVQSGGRVLIDDVPSSGKMGSRVYVDDSSSGHAFAFVDCDTLVKMPKRVTFRGDNGKYLKAYLLDKPFLQFSSEDGNEKRAAYEVKLNPDGHVRIMSEKFGKFWRRSPNSNHWILADSADDSGEDKDTLFWPVKVDDNTIALRNAGNDHFCSRLTADNKTDCLNAAVSNINCSEAKLVVEELLFERNIYNVRYRMEDARVFDERPFVAGTGAATNASETDSSLSIIVRYEDSRTYSFSNSLSIMTGVKTTIEAGMPGIVDGQIVVSTEITGSFEWGKTEEKKSAEAQYTVTVPARSRARVNYVGTQGSCSVPFSYTQRDKSSSDGSFITSQHIDGIFTGANYYSFRFEQLEIEPL